mmetsp:Transcript_34666/g.82719  ORF Transcript_34666/g.82719 Transcript_34666/m.82719 type:complete len:214 (-) Transcript_34666:192-833(-)
MSATTHMGRRPAWLFRSRRRPRRDSWSGRPGGSVTKSAAPLASPRRGRRSPRAARPSRRNMMHIWRSTARRVWIQRCSCCRWRTRRRKIRRRCWRRLARSACTRHARPSEPSGACRVWSSSSRRCPHGSAIRSPRRAHSWRSPSCQSAAVLVPVTGPRARYIMRPRSTSSTVESAAPASIPTRPRTSRVPPHPLQPSAAGCPPPTPRRRVPLR